MVFGSVGGAVVVAFLLIVLAALLVPAHLMWVHRVRRSLSRANWSRPTRLAVVVLAAATPLTGFVVVTLARRDWVRTGGWRRLWPLAGVTTVAAMQVRQEARYTDAFGDAGRLASLLASGMALYAILFVASYMAAHVLLGTRRPPWESAAHGVVVVLLVTIQLAGG